MQASDGQQPEGQSAGDGSGDLACSSYYGEEKLSRFSSFFGFFGIEVCKDCKGVSNLASAWVVFGSLPNLVSITCIYPAVGSQCSFEPPRHLMAARMFQFSVFCPEQQLSRNQTFWVSSKQPRNASSSCIDAFYILVHPYESMYASMIWFKGTSTGKYGYSHQVWWFPAKCLLNQSNERTFQKRSKPPSWWSCSATEESTTLW